MLPTASPPPLSPQAPASAAPGQASAHLASSLSAMVHPRRRSLSSPSRLAPKVLTFPVLPRALLSVLIDRARNDTTTALIHSLSHRRNCRAPTCSGAQSHPRKLCRDRAG